MSTHGRAVQHGRYTIKVWPDGDGFSGRAMLGTKGVTEQMRGATADGLVAKIADAVRRHQAALAGGRGPSETPTAAEYEEALLAVNDRMTEAQTQMLRALYEARDRTLTATQLAFAAGHVSFSYANLHFGLLGKMIAEEVGYSPSLREDGSVRMTTTLATGADDSSDEGSAHYRWTMRPELAEALGGAARILLTAPNHSPKRR